jgi:hypothetical protein
MLKAYIKEHPKRNGKFSVYGFNRKGDKIEFKAVVRNMRGDFTVYSDDPEHDYCWYLRQTGEPDDSITFFRGNTPSLMYKSFWRASLYQIYPRDTGGHWVCQRGETPVLDREKGAMEAV